MTPTQEQRDELRRLHAAAQKALENERQTLADARAGQAESKEELAARLIGKIKADAAYQDAATSNLIPLLDALEAAEAEQDRLRADVLAYQRTIARCEVEGQKDAATIVRMRKALQEIATGRNAAGERVDFYQDIVAAALGEQP